MHIEIHEFAHDTPGKIVSYRLHFSEGAFENAISLDVPEVFQLRDLLDRELAANELSNWHSERFLKN